MHPRGVADPGPPPTSATDECDKLRLPAVPADEFVTFRVTCSSTLPADQTGAVLARLDATAAYCHQRLGSDGARQGTVATLLYEILNPAPADPELITDLRALQIAAWHHDLYVRIDLPRLLASQERPRVRAEIADQKLTAYRQPYRAITVALTRQGVAVDQIAGITLDDTTDDGQQIACGHRSITLSRPAAQAVRAQRHLRHTHGATGDDVLLPHSTKALAKALTDAAEDLNLRVHGRRAERTRDHTEGALRALGITVMSMP